MTSGEPPVLVSRGLVCPDCGDVHDIEKCPRCGSFIELGYGLMGGGMGAYKFCSSDACAWMWKRLDPIDAG